MRCVFSTIIMISLMCSTAAYAAAKHRIGVSVSDNDAATLGITINDIDKDSPADNAGLRKGDEILEINGSRIYSPQEFLSSIHYFGDTVGGDMPVPMKVLRNGNEFLVTSYVESSGLSDDLTRAAVVGGTSAAVGWFLVTFGGEILCLVGVAPACACVGPQC